jgi:hypothetical protein
MCTAANHSSNQQDRVVKLQALGMQRQDVCRREDRERNLDLASEGERSQVRSKRDPEAPIIICNEGC